MWPFMVVPCLVSSLRVLDFEAAMSADPGSTLSSALLTSLSQEELPSQFILCFSINHNKIDGKTPFIVYGEDNKPWLAFSFWKSSFEVFLWVDVQTGNFTRLHNVRKPWTHVWMHVCADVDTLTGHLAVSLNGGKPIRGRNENLQTNRPYNLKDKIETGLSKENFLTLGSPQFVGLITNINIFSKKEQCLENMTRYPCDEGDFLAWSNTGFEQKGQNIRVFEDGSVCSFEDTYDIILPVPTTWPTANHQCKGLGQMTQIENEFQVASMIALAKQRKIACTGIWMPISDEVKEGEYINTNTRDMETFLPWKKGQPNGGVKEAFVALVLEGTGSYWDLPGEDKLCVSCTLKTGKIFRLRGMCKETLLGQFREKKRIKNFRSLALTICDLCWFEDLEEKDE